jgi:ABC-2 type transport system permease protein
MPPMLENFSIVNRVGFMTLVDREWKRTVKILNQVIWPPMITTLLYVFVFGLGLGSRIKSIGGVPYAAFLIPGLMMLQVIDAAYGESSSSLFQGRFLGSIAEVLVAPLSAFEMLAGYLVAGMMRSFVIATLILVVGMLTTHVVPHLWLLMIIVVALVAILFSSLGVIFGLRAKTFDNIAVLTTFVIMPLTFVGGIFTPISFLPPQMRLISLFNPIFYMIDALRYSFTQSSDVPIFASLGITFVLCAAATITAYQMIARGYRLRE